MSNVQNPTYFLAPNWNFRPGGRIAIGNIIRNPLKPHLYLTKADPNKPMATEFSREKNWRLSVELATNLSLSLWDVFLQKIHVSALTNREQIKSSNYTMTSLDTVYLLEDPSPEEIKIRCNDPLVREYMRPESVLCSPVYMVTGIKIAKEFKLGADKSMSRGSEGEVGGEVHSEASIETSTGVSKRNWIADEFEADGDIVFAYQLMKIKPKGWFKGKTYDTSEYQCRQAFLSDERSENSDEFFDGEGEAITLKDIEAFNKAQVIEFDGATVAYERPPELQ